MTSARVRAASRRLADRRGRPGRHFLICRLQRNVAITGEGTIDGNGDAFFDPEPIRYFSWMTPQADAWWNGIRWSKDKEKLRPGQLVVFIRSTDVRVEGVTIRNSPCWCLFFHGCENVTVRNYTARCGMNDGNTDGLDIVFRDCDLSAVRLGYVLETDGDRLEFGIRNVTFENCRFGARKGSVSAASGCRFSPEKVVFR